jgi:Uma2 family endonuclease
MMKTVMAVAELVTAEQYLHSTFEHDAEFVEGRLVQRIMPTWEHAAMQGFLTRELWAICRGLGFFAVPEQRVQTRPNRFRVPDVCVVTDKPEGEPGRRIVTRPPYLCVEILSPEDTAIETMAKLREYLDLGVAWVWIIDPVSLAGQVHSRNSVVSREDRIFSTDRFSVDLSKAEL